MGQAGATAKVRTSLGLGGDGDELELIHDLERTFAMTFDTAELERATTVGEIENAVWRHLAHCAGDKCITAMAFYKLRRLLRGLGVKHPIAITDPIAPLATSPRAFAALLKRETGMHFHYRYKRRGRFGANLQIGWLAAMGLQFFGFGWPALAALSLALLGIVLMRRDAGRFIEGQTVGDVAKLLATQSYGYFARRGGRIDQSEVLARVRALMAEFQGFAPAEIGAETLLLGKKYSVFSRG